MIGLQEFTELVYGSDLTAIEVLAGIYPPSPDMLLNLLRADITEADLMIIAEADYGFERDKHLASLRVIRDIGRVPDLLDWHPGEVLELIRWSEPDWPDWKPGETGETGHRMRAFACAVLLRAGNEETDTLAQMLGSSFVLGVPCVVALLRFLLWRLVASSNLVDAEYDPFLFLSVLLAYVWLPVSDVETAEVKFALLILFVDEFEERKKTRRFAKFARLPALAETELRRGAWKTMAHEILIDPTNDCGVSEDAAIALARIGRQFTRL